MQIQSFVRGGPILTTFFLVDGGREDPNTTISGPSSARQQNAIKWLFARVPIMDDGLTDPEFCKRGSNLTTFFLVDEGREDPNTTISGPSSARQQNAIKWLFARVLIMDDGPTLNAGLVAL